MEKRGDANPAISGSVATLPENGLPQPLPAASVFACILAGLRLLEQPLGIIQTPYAERR